MSTTARPIPRAAAAPDDLDHLVTVDDVVVVREAGLPLDVLTGFHHEELDRLLVALARQEQEVADHTRALLDVLYAEAGSRPETERQAVVDLRRSVARGHRDPRTDELSRTLSADASRELEAWLAGRCRVGETRRLIEEQLASATAAEVAHLRAACGDEGFLTGLRATNPELGAMAERWAGDEQARPQRKRMLALARMAARAAAKTSPFSTWMTAAVTVWGAPGAAQGHPRLALELDGGTLDAIRAELGAVLGPAGTRLRVNPSLVHDDGGYLLVRDAGSGQSVRVRSHPVVDAVLDAIRPGDSPAELGERIGVSDEVVGQLVAGGLLEVSSPVADLDPALWASWSRVALEQGCAELALLLADLHAVLRGGDGAAARTAGRALMRHLGIDDQHVAVHEMAIVDAPYADAPPAPDPATVAELDAARRLLALHDNKLAVKLAAGNVLARTFGDDYDVPLTRALDVLWAAAREPSGDFARIAGPGAPPWGADLRVAEAANLRALGEWQRGCVRAVLEQAGAGVPLTVDDVDRLVASAPVRHPNTSATCYVQHTEEPGLGLVVNVIHGGHGRGRGRLALHGATAPGGLTAHTDPTAVEVCGLLGSTLNRRLPVAPRELQYPGATSARVPEEQLALGGVRAVAGEHGLPTLRSGDGEPLTLLHLGMAADLSLPPLARTLEQVFGSSFLVHPSTPTFVPTQPGDYPAEARIPRLVLGRTVLQRERIFLQREILPPSRPGGPSVEEWHRWLAVRGLPSRFFLRAWNPADAARQSKARKPVYVDVTSPLLLADAEKLLKGARFAIVEECLPDPLAAAGRTTELAVQLGVTR